MNALRWIGFAVLLAALLVVAAFRSPDGWNVFASPAAPVRDITLVARGMAFELDGQAGQINPALAVGVGERLRITVRNETAGITHDFAIPEWRVATPLLATGDTAQLLVDIPPGTREVSYLCNPHAQMMQGTIRVSDPASERPQP